MAICNIHMRNMFEMIYVGNSIETMRAKKVMRYNNTDLFCESCSLHNMYELYIVTIYLHNTTNIKIKCILI